MGEERWVIQGIPEESGGPPIGDQRSPGESEGIRGSPAFFFFLVLKDGGAGEPLPADDKHHDDDDGLDEDDDKDVISGSALVKVMIV